MKRQYKIKEVVEKLVKDYDLWVSDDAIYLYESKGYIQPDRDLGTSFRLYSEKDVARIAQIAGMSQFLPFNLEFINQLINDKDLWVKDDCRDKIKDVRKWLKIAEGLL